jgi:hypothetical protein
MSIPTKQDKSIPTKEDEIKEFTVQIDKMTPKITVFALIKKKIANEDSLEVPNKIVWFALPITFEVKEAYRHDICFVVCKKLVDDKRADHFVKVWLKDTNYQVRPSPLIEDDREFPELKITREKAIRVTKFETYQHLTKNWVCIGIYSSENLSQRILSETLSK